MKFKKESAGDQERCIHLVDDEGDTLRVSSWDDSRYKIIITMGEEAFGLKRKKALKLAWAIIDELSPVASS